jgi:hypothetical protein
MNRPGKLKMERGGIRAEVMSGVDTSIRTHQTKCDDSFAIPCDTITISGSELKQASSLSAGSQRCKAAIVCIVPSSLLHVLVACRIDYQQPLNVAALSGLDAP